MANFLYRSARTSFTKGELNWETDENRVYALDAAFVGDPGHVYLSDTAILATGLDHDVLTGCVSLDDGVCDADDSAFTAVTSGLTVSKLVIVQWNTTNADARLIAYIDQGWDGMPMGRTSDGSTIGVGWSEFPQRVFRL